VIALPTWLVVGAVFFSIWLAHKCLIVGRAQAWIRAMNAIELVSRRYGQGDDTPLDGPEAEVGLILGASLANLIEGYTREQAEEIAQAPR
jgi:hypothetical protein